MCPALAELEPSFLIIGQIQNIGTRKRFEGMGVPLGLCNNQASQIWWPQFRKIMQQSSILASTLLSVVTINNVDFLFGEEHSQLH